jgi:glutamate/tyrosine decarboxylase-like PLP-dependent enzyme
MTPSSLSDHLALDAGRSAPNELAPDEFRALGHDLVERIAGFLASIRERRVTPGETAPQVRAALGATRTLPTDGAEAGALLQRAADLVFRHSTLNGHPRFFGYITSSAAPIGALADLLASSVNPNLGGWSLAPIGTEIELQTIRWIAELLGFPTTGGGVLVSGGNMANMVCAWAATRRAATWDIREDGIGAHRMGIYATAETHTWIEKFADLSGLGTRAIRRIPTDPLGRADVAALRRLLDEDAGAGVVPAFVIGTAGTVSTGVIDPLLELAALCRERKIWFHVDGAYGAPVAALPDAPADFRGLALADSIAVDPHKWLYAPVEAGCALVRDAEHLRETFSFTPPYYRFQKADEEPPVNFFERSPQNSRAFRALKVWLGMQQAGREGIARSIATDIALAERLFANAEQHPELEAMAQGLSIAAFRYVPDELRDADPTDAAAQARLDDLNEQLLFALQEEGEAYLSNAVIRGRFALRACIVNFRTTEEDVDALPGIVVRTGRRVFERLRADAAR